MPGYVWMKARPGEVDEETDRETMIVDRVEWEMANKIIDEIDEWRTAQMELRASTEGAAEAETKFRKSDLKLSLARIRRAEGRW